jgi:hypothetical protein
VVSSIIALFGVKFNFVKKSKPFSVARGMEA